MEEVSGTPSVPGVGAAWSYSHELYPRILDLIDRIRDCQSRFDLALSQGKPGGLRALGYASQIVADAQELRVLLQARNEGMT